MSSFRCLALLLLCGVVASGRLLADDAKDSKDKLRVLIIDGQNNHDWRAMTPFMKKMFEKSGRFTVDVSTNLNKGDKLPEGWMSVPFPPDLEKYDVLVSNYNGASWPEKFNKQLEERLEAGKIGLVIIHAANNSFGGWKEYNRMIGMGWRDKNYGDRLLLDDSGKPVRIPKGQGDSTGHRDTRPFQVVIRDGDHPVTKGMPREWLHARDELYDNLRGPIENVHMLATAYSKGTKVHEPMIFTVSFGKGRVFHTPMGHVGGGDITALRCVGFITTMLRGTEWAATGKVTLPIPDNFPGPDKESSVPAK